jgi:hypothetical protein
MSWIQFTAFISVTVGDDDNPRIANIRDLEYAAYSVNQALADESTINLSRPYTTDKLGRFNSIGQITPAFGDTPALVKITGYHDYDVSGSQHPAVTVFNSNEEVSGSGPSHLWDSNPSSDYYDGVLALKDILDTNIPDYLADSYDFEVYRINYAGTVWGNRGLSF